MSASGTVRLQLRRDDLIVIRDALCDQVLLARRESADPMNSDAVQALWINREQEARETLGRLLIAIEAAS